jgi:hypothetical protein
MPPIYRAINIPNLILKGKVLQGERASFFIFLQRAQAESKSAPICRTAFWQFIGSGFYLFVRYLGSSRSLPFHHVVAMQKVEPLSNSCKIQADDTGSEPSRDRQRVRLAYDV